MGQDLETLSLAFDESNLLVLNIALGIVMFGVALGLRVEDFIRLVKSPRIPLIGLVSQWVLLPAWTAVLIVVVDPVAGIALGLCLVACCPGGNVSNFLVDFGRGNAALSVTLTLASSLLAALLTPVVFVGLVDFIPSLQDINQQIHVDLIGMFKLIAGTVLLPLVLGLSVNELAPKVSGRLRKPAQWLSLAILAAFIVVAFIANRATFLEFIGVVFLLVIAHNTGALLLGWGWSTLTGLRVDDRRAVTLETGIQNSGLGLIIIFNFFDGYGPMALIAAWWGVWHLISGFGLASLWRYRSREASAVEA